MSKEGDRAEEALFSNEQELRLLVETIPALMWRAGPEGNVEYVNKRLLEYLGATLAEITGDGWMERVHPDDVAFKTKSWLTNLESETPHDAVCRFRGSDGRYRWFLVSGAPLKASDGRVLHWYGVLIDIDDRREAEEALRESEYQLFQIIDSVPALLWSLDSAGEPIQLNQRLLDYTGMRLEDFKRGGWEAMLHPDDFPETARAFYHAIQTGTSYQVVARFRRADGEFRWHHTRGEPLRDRQGRIVHWYGLSVDIDEGKKAEDLLRRSEAHLAAAQRLSHTGASAFNNSTILYWSEEMYRIWGFDPAQGIPSREAAFQRVHPDDRDRMRAEVERVLREKKGSLSEFRIVLPDGTVKHLKSIREPVFSASGELVEIVGTQIDVTERKRAEQALRESEAKFRDYAESASDWFWEIGPDYRFTLLTENAFGSDAAGRIGATCWDRALDLETEPEKWRLVQATLDSRKPFRDFVYCSARRNGSPIYVKASGKPVFDADGEFRGYRGTGTDVTALMRAQEEHERLRQLESDLAHMNRLSMMGELAASLSHEILHPIGTARNNARAAMRFADMNPPDMGEVREALACVVRDVDRAKDIVGRMRDHIKKAPPRKDRFGLNEAVNEVIVMVQSAIAKNGISLRTQLMDGLVPVWGDRVQLQQVAVNLILNAVEAMGSVEDGVRELSIRTKHSQTGGVFFAVHDSGPGIDPGNFERVFEPFYTTKASGIGMGLSICRSIVDGHGGRLWVASNEPRGAVFQFTLPAQGDS